MNITIMAQNTDAAAIATEAIIGMQHAAETIPLNRLVPSKANVRRINGTANISELADSIEAHGLIHNLTVRKAKKGRYEVIAGSRRLAALRLLAKEGRLAEDAEIPCNVRDAENDAELSLAENVQREAMHVVDEILAYRELAEGGMAPDRIASRFGQSVITVRQRLRLADLSPKLLDVMREDGLSLEQARALTISDSHEEQERVWFDAPSYQRDPRSLRAMLTRAHVRSTDRLARLVGLEAYEAAGGGVLRDLFGDDTSTFLTDQALLAQLVNEILERAAEPLKIGGWKWVETSLDASSIYNSGYARIYPQVRDLTEDEQAEFKSLAQSLDELQAELEAYAEGDAIPEADEARLAELEARMAAIEDGRRVYDVREMALAGCIVYADHGGAVTVAQGYVKPDDRAALERLRRSEDAAETQEYDEEAPAPSAAQQPSGYSAALVEELTAIRTAALRIEVTNRPTVALAALLYPLVGRIFHHRAMAYDAAVEVFGQQRDLAQSIKEPTEARALAAWEAMKEAWGDVLPGQRDDLWTWLLDQPTDRLLELLAFVTAANLNGVKSKVDHSPERLANADRIAEAAGLDMRQHWTADARFLGRLSKAEIAGVLDEMGCPAQVVRSIEKAPKSEAVTAAESQMQGKGWLPAVIRSTLPAGRAAE